MSDGPRFAFDPLAFRHFARLEGEFPHKGVMVIKPMFKVENELGVVIRVRDDLDFDTADGTRSRHLEDLHGLEAPGFALEDVVELLELVHDLLDLPRRCAFALLPHDPLPAHVAGEGELPAGVDARVDPVAGAFAVDALDGEEGDADFTSLVTEVTLVTNLTEFLSRHDPSSCVLGVLLRRSGSHR